MTEQSIRDEAWKEFAHREHYGYTNTEANVAFDGGWAAALASPVIRRIQAEAWSEGAAWAAVECGAIEHETQPWEATGDNPYIEKNSEGNET